MSASVCFFAEIKNSKGKWISTEIEGIDEFGGQDTFELLGYGYDYGFGEEPIAPSRGLPGDVSREVKQERKASVGETEDYCAGDSWLLLSEILGHSWYAGPIRHGSVKLDYYSHFSQLRAFDREPDANEWCDVPDFEDGQVEVSPGHADRIIEQGSDVPFANIWVRISWVDRLRNRLSYFYDEIVIGRLKRYADDNQIDYDDLRVVFWFNY